MKSATTAPMKAAGIERPQLSAMWRTQPGSRPSKRLRQAGGVPGVVYGKATAPMPISVNRRELLKFLHARGGERSLLTLRVAGEKDKGWEQPVLMTQVQHDPVNGEITHVDFHAIVLTEQIRVKVPIVLIGEPIGVKQDRGVMEHFLREIEVECLPTQIPKQVECAVERMKVGDTIHVKDLTPPSGAKIITDLESGVAAVIAPREEKAEETAAAVTEPEVIREKKPEAGAEAGEEKKAEKKDEKKPDAKEEKKEK